MNEKAGHGYLSGGRMKMPHAMQDAVETEANRLSCAAPSFDLQQLVEPVG
jgi:hypothetical protein